MSWRKPINPLTKAEPKAPKTLDDVLGLPGQSRFAIKSPFELSAEERNAVARPKVSTVGKRRLPGRFLDPEEFAAQIALLKAQEANLTASQNRQDRVIQRSAQNQIAILDVQHRFQLISEESFTEQVDLINKKREADAIAVAQTTVKALEGIRKKLGASIKADADQAAVDKRIADARAHRDDLIAESQQSDKIRAVRLKGEAAERSRKQAAFAAEAGSNIVKLREAGELQRRDARDAIKATVIPQSEAVQIAARNAVERSFLTEKARLEKELETLTAKKDERSLEQARQIPALLRTLQAQLEVEKGVAAASAKVNFDLQREFDFGWQQAFNSYVESATNAAQSARDVFTITTRAMEDAIINFTKTGKLSFRDFANVVVEELLRIQAKQVAVGIIGGITNLLGIGNPFGPTAAASTALGSLGTTPLSQQSLQLAAQVRHSGGLIGRDMPVTRTVPSSVFSGAPSFGVGGLVGGEVPVIAHRGEGVFTPGQMRALAPAGGGDQFQIIVNVSADSGAVNVQGNSSADSRRLAEVIGVAVRKELQQQQRPGGLLTSNAR